MNNHTNDDIVNNIRQGNVSDNVLCIDTYVAYMF